MNDHKLEEIYTKDALEMQKQRYAKAAAEFRTLYGTDATDVFSAPGRTEVGGNHTDHQYGRVLAAGVSLDVIAMVVPSDDSVIEVKSEGFPALHIGNRILIPKEGLIAWIKDNTGRAN